MIDYDFYENDYLGSAIPEKSFSGVAARAVEGLERLKRRYRVLPTDEMSEKMALCAMAEALYQHMNRKQSISAATVGGVSVRYENTGTQKLQHKLLEQARIYLDIYRGTKQ